MENRLHSTLLRLVKLNLAEEIAQIRLSYGVKKLIDREELRQAILETAMRVLVFRAGGEIIITKDDYLSTVDETKHFHFEKRDSDLRFYMIPAMECTAEAHEQEQSISPKLYGPGGGIIQ